MSRPIQREGSRQIRGWHITAAVLLAGAVMIAVVVLVGIPETPPPSPAGTNAVLTTRGTGPGDMVDWHVNTVTGIDEAAIEAIGEMAVGEYVFYDEFFIRLIKYVHYFMKYGRDKSGYFVGAEEVFHFERQVTQDHG